MSLSAGVRIGPFEIVELLGAGAMGAVYRAHDTRLRRDVAIKVLPQEFSGQPERLKRFEQEALAVARLTHPHIIAIHDIGTYDGAPYIVMELLGGESLRSRMKGRPLVPRKAVEYAIQIARGLATAHEHGIVHRDIKPDNLFVTTEGRVKILDFGIAKLTDIEATAEATAETLTVHAFIGTPAYMSPEQARGIAADHRADIFSLGVVLYEMLSGVSPFRRDTAVETMGAIIDDEPPPLPDTPASPPALQRIIRHCLEKAPSDRYQSARDLAFHLEEWTDAAATTTTGAPRRGSWPRRIRAGALVLALAAAAFIAGRQAALPDRRQALAEIYRLTDFTGLEEFPALSNDLKSVAFTARVNGHRQIFVRLLAGGPPLQITSDATDHEVPRWSRDDSAILYFSPATPGDLQGTIREVPALGGAPRPIIESIGSGDVGSDGRLTFFRLAEGQVELVTASAEASDGQVIARFSASAYFKFPRWSPDSRWIAYQSGDGFRWDIFVVPTTGGSPRQLTHENQQIHGLAWRADSSGVVYSSSRDTTMAYLPALGLWDVPLAGGEPSRVGPLDLSYLYPDLRTGTLVASRLRMQSDLWRYPVQGTPAENMSRALRLTRQTGQLQTPTVSSIEHEIAFLSDTGGHANLWITNTETRGVRQITHERDPTVALGVPIWSPDGRWIAFVSSRGNTGLGFGIWVVSPDGGNLRQLAPHGLGAAWSHDGQWVYYADAGAIYKVPAAGGSPVSVRSGPARNVIGVRDETLYFMVDRTLTDGRPGFEIHAATPEGAASRLVAHIPAGRAPQWQIINPSLSPDGTALAMPLTDGVTTNIWTLSTSSGEWRPITDFGDRPVFIARRVSWSSDGRAIVAAVSEGDSDVVLFARPR